jgi:zinc protease
MYTRKPKHSLPGPDDTLHQTLPNGITVMARENFASPAVVINGYLEAGAEDESPEQAGLASFTAEVVARGTERRSFDQLYEEVESVGANFGLGAGTHLTTFGAKGLAENLPLLLDILSDVLRHPAFEPRHVEKARSEILTALEERAYNTRHMAALTFKELAYPADHPYHYSVDGYSHTVTPLTRDDLINFHQRMYSPQGMVIVVVGAIKRQDALQAITDVLGDWQATRSERVPLPPAPPPAERREKRLSIPDQTQSDLVLGWPSLSREDPDFLKCYVTNTILGVFGMMGRLGQSVREKSGLAYYAYSRLEGGKGPGAWRITAGVDPANVERTLVLIQEELQTLRDTWVSKEELSDSQTYLTGRLPIELETNEGVAQALLNIERYNLGMDYLYRYRDLIMDVTRQDMQAMAQQWLDPEHYALAVAEPEQ